MTNLTKFILRIGLSQGTYGWLDCQTPSVFVTEPVIPGEKRHYYSTIILPYSSTILLLWIWKQKCLIIYRYQLSSSKLPHCILSSTVNRRKHVSLPLGKAISGVLAFLTAKPHAQDGCHTTVGKMVNYCLHASCRKHEVDGDCLFHTKFGLQRIENGCSGCS